MAAIPEQLRIPAFRFCLIRGGDKRPFEPGWQKEGYVFDDPKLVNHSGNYGVVCGFGGLVVLDVDEPVRIKALVDHHTLPNTFTVRTGGGGYHFYFVSPDIKEKIVLRDANGDHLGELQATGSQVVGPGSTHPNGNAYAIVNDVPIAEISGADLLAVLDPVIPQKSNVARLEEVAKTRRRPPTATDSDPFANVSILDAIDTSGFSESGGQLFGEHPVHGSETGHNLVVNPDKNSWWCGRCETGGGPALWVAVEEGIIDCSEARPGALTGRTFIEVLEAAERRGLIAGKGTPKPPDGGVPEDIKQRALVILETGDPIEYVMSQFRRFHVGDDKLAKVLLASVISGTIKNSKGIQPKPSGRSGAGKTHACKAMAHVMPPGTVIEASVSAKALFYLKGLPPGGVIFSDDVTMSEDLEGTLKRSMTNFQEGTTHITLSRNREVLELVLPERLTWWLTSVHNHFSDELINRMFGLNVKEDKETDAAVYEHEMRGAVTADEELPVDEGVLVAREIVNQIRQNVYLVAVPFAERIRMADVSDRRNAGRLLDLIRAAAVMRLFQRATRIRDDGIVEVCATESDFTFAEELFEDRASNLIHKVNDTEDELLKFIAQRGQVTGSEIVRDFKLPDGRGVSKGYVSMLLHGRKDRGGKGLLDRITGLDYKNEAVRTDEGKTTYQNVYSLHTVYNQWDRLNKAVWLEPERVYHEFTTSLPPTVKEEPLAVERITETGLPGLPGLPIENGTKENPGLDSSSDLSGQNVGKPGKLVNTTPTDSDSSGKPDGKHVVNPTSQLVALARRHGGRLSLEDCTRAGIGRDKAVFLLGMLTDQYGWEKETLVSGLTVWRPSAVAR